MSLPDEFEFRHYIVKSTVYTAKRRLTTYHVTWPAQGKIPSGQTSYTIPHMESNIRDGIWIIEKVEPENPLASEMFELAAELITKANQLIEKEEVEPSSIILNGNLASYSTKYGYTESVLRMGGIVKIEDSIKGVCKIYLDDVDKLIEALQAVKKLGT